MNTPHESTQIAVLQQRLAEMEAALQQRDQLLQTLVEAMPAIVYIRDRQGRFTLVNRQHANLLKHDRDQIIGKTSYDLFPKEIADKFHQDDQQIIATTQTLEVDELVPQADGLHTYHSIKFPICDAAGNVYAIGGISIDITAGKRAEASLREQETLFQTIMDHTPDGVSLTWTDGTFFYANPAYRTMTGYGDELIGLTIFDVYAEPLEVLGDIAHEAATNGYWQGALTIQQPGGTSVPCEVSITTLKDAAGEPQIFATIARDLTEQKRVEQERIALQELVIAAQRATLRELSTPLIPIAVNVVAMPLVGAIDSARAQQILETLLEGVAAHQAAVAIVDITGVSVVDTQVAQALVQAAQAVKLLGAQVVLTGIHPEVAQTLVQLGADLRGIVTRSTLQLGIAYALHVGPTGDGPSPVNRG